MIRELEKKDYKDYIELLSQLTTVGGVTQDQFNRFVDSQTIDHRTIVYEFDDRIIGCVTIFIEQKLSHSFGKVMHIEDVVTHKNFRGRRVSSSLVKWVKDIAEVSKCYKIILDCNQDNISFYQKLGFTQKEFQMNLKIKE